MKKYDRRIIARNNLTDLESTIIALESEGFELDPTVPDENSGTLLGTLRAIRNKSGVHISMRREIK